MEIWNVYKMRAMQAMQPIEDSLKKKIENSDSENINSKVVVVNKCSALKSA